MIIEYPAFLFKNSFPTVDNKVSNSDRAVFCSDEAGHLGQNISLLATELELGSCALGGFVDAEVDRLLDIDFTKETTLYLIAIGKL